MKKFYKRPEVISDDSFEQTANQTGIDLDVPRHNCDRPSYADFQIGCEGFQGDGCDYLPSTIPTHVCEIIINPQDSDACFVIEN